MGRIYIRLSGAKIKRLEIMANSGIFEKSSIPQNILSNANIGLWAIELETGKPPRMFANEIMCNLLGINGKKLAPEEIYNAWYNNINPNHYDVVTDAIQKMTNGEQTEVEYFFNHPKNGEMYVRFSGNINPVYKNFLRFEGFHRDITEIQHIQKEIKVAKEEVRTLSVINCLAENFDYVGFFNMNNNSIIRYHASDIFIKALNNIQNTVNSYERLHKFYDTYIYPSDMEYFESCNSKEKVQKMIKKYGTYQFDVRFVLDRVPEYYRFKFVLSPEDKSCFIFGIYNVNEEIRNEIDKLNQDVNIRLMQEEKENLLRIMDLTDEFECIYDVDIDSGKFSSFTKSGNLTENLIAKLDFNENYFVTNKKVIPIVIHKDDQKMMLKSLTKENFLQQLQDKNSFSLDYRFIMYNEPYWYRMKIVKVGDWSNVRKVRVGLFNNNENYIKNEILKNHIQDEQFYRRAILKDAYSYYKVNLAQNKIISKIIEKDGDKEIDYTDKFGSVLSSYDNVVKFSAKAYVDKTFRDSYVLSLSRENLINQFNAGNTMPEYSCLIHSSILGWHYRKYVNYISKDEKTDEILSMTVAYNITDQIQQEEEEKERNEIINALAKDYSAIYYVDLKNDLITPYILNNDNQSEEQIELNKERSFEKMITSFRNNSIHPEDQAGFTDRFYDLIINKKIKESFSMYVRKNYKGTYLYTEIQCVKIGENKKTSETFIFALAEKDSMFRAELEIQEKLKQDILVINTLASEYSSVFYVNLKNKKLVLYSTNEHVSKSMQQFNFSSMKITTAFTIYVNNFIYEPDRERILAEGNLDTILERLSNKKSYDLIFRVKTNKGPEYRQMKFVKMDDVNKAPTAIAFALADRDDEIINRYITNQITSEYNAIFYLDVNTGNVRTIKQSNDYKQGQFEISNINILSSTILSLIEPEYKEEWENILNLKVIQEMLKNVDTREMTFQLHGVERPWRRCQWQVIERKKGLPSIVIIYFRVIDDAAAEKLELTNKLEDALSLAQSANRAKTTFLNSMSHDIRTPMNAILGFTNLASTHIDNKEQVLNYLSKIQQSSSHLLSLINDVLDMSRIESGKINLSERTENLGEILHSLRDIIQFDIHAKQIELVIDTIDLTDEHIICDKLRLNQILLNLLSNAVKYTHPGGRIEMHISEKKMPNKDFANFEFKIKDNGIGMSEEFVKTIFEPFTRETSATISGIQGTGLGMAITKNIVDMMGGTISVQSKLNVGSEFTVSLVFKLDKEHNKLSPIKSLEGLKGLVIDDDENICCSISGMLSDIGITADYCTNGKEGIQKYADAIDTGNEYSILVIDWLMPEMNGIETARKIREVSYSFVPIIVLSAYDWSDVEQEAIDAGINGFISKPLFPSDLHSVLAKCVGEEKNKKDEITHKELKNKKILLVEDNDFNQEIANEILTEAGMQVTIANDGTKAVDEIKNSKPGDYDLILMDIQMPTMDGYEATKLIRQLKNKKLAQIPIIAMTANAFEEDKQKAISYGMNDHISKPIDIKKLLSILKEVLN